MIRTKLSRAGFFILMMVLFSSGCATDRNEYRYERARQKVENNTPSFNPTYYKSEESKHIAIIFQIFEGDLAPTDQPAQIRPGRIPYRSKTAGNMIVIYRSANGEEIGRYAIEDPVLARSCDFDKGNNGVTTMISLGTAEVLLPYNTNIASVEIGNVDGKSKRFDIRSQLEKSTEM